MEFCMKKINANTSRSFFIQIFAIGKRVESDLCVNGKKCQNKDFFKSLKDLLEAMACEEAHLSEKTKFIELAKKNLKKFLIFEQIWQRFGEDFSKLEDEDFKMAVFYEADKANCFVKQIEVLKTTNAKILTLEKLFL